MFTWYTGSADRPPTLLAARTSTAFITTTVAFAIFTGILLMYVVLVLLFGSFFHPITILAALPVSFSGAFFALLITGKSMSMPALIGIIMLMALMFMLLRNRVTGDKAETVEMIGLYWHFVDIVWIIIFTLVYLIPA